MEIKTYTDERAIVLYLDGNLDGSTSEYTQEILLSNITSERLFAIDMSNCPYVSSAGLRVLLITAKQLTKIGGKGIFIALKEEVKDVMDMTGFSNMFDNFDNLDDALMALRKE